MPDFVDDDPLVVLKVIEFSLDGRRMCFKQAKTLGHGRIALPSQMNVALDLCNGHACGPQVVHEFYVVDVGFRILAVAVAAAVHRRKQ
jgi:hypothetical protein